MIKLSLAVALTFSSVAANAQEKIPQGYFRISPTSELVTGETWKQDGNQYRLYGVQSCIRGTFYTSKTGQKTDCGAVSLALFAAFIKDTEPLCAPVYKTTDITYVSCYSSINKDRLDLANLLIRSGFAFASLKKDGKPQIPKYWIVEQAAAKDKSGLWSFKDVPHPSILLSRAANQKEKK